MTDSFTANHVQGQFGKFAPVFDFATNAATADNAQGLFGQFKPVLDEAGAAVGGLSIPIAMYYYRKRRPG